MKQRILFCLLFISILLYSLDGISQCNPPGPDSRCNPGNSFGFETVSNGSWTSSSTWQGGNVPAVEDINGSHIKIMHDVTVTNNNIKLKSAAVLYVVGGSLILQNGNLELLDGSNEKAIFENSILRTSGNIQQKENTTICITDCIVDVGEERALVNFVPGNFGTSANFQNDKGFRRLENVCINVTHDYQNLGEDVLIEVCMDIGDEGVTDGPAGINGGYDGQDSGNFQNESGDGVTMDIWDSEFYIANGDVQNSSFMSVCNADFRLTNGNFQVQSDSDLLGTGLVVWLNHPSNGDIQNSGNWSPSTVEKWREDDGHTPDGINLTNPSSPSVMNNCFEDCCQPDCIFWGGDSDNDGVCNDLDCAPLNPNLPTNPGTPCDDNNPNTINDVILDDGCTCQGTPQPCNLSATFSVSDDCLDVSYLLFADANDPYFPPNNPNYVYNYDIQPANTVGGTSMADPRSLTVTFSSPGIKTVTATVTDPNVPNCSISLTASFNVEDCTVLCPNGQPMQPPGTPCNDGNPNTINDVIQTDGCSCAGTPVGDPCDDVSITDSNGQITISGLGSSPIAQVQVFNSNWQTEFSCSGNCNNTEVVNVPSGSYHVFVKLRNASWQLICEVEKHVIVGGGCSPSLDINDVTVDESDGLAIVQVCLSCSSNSTVMFDYTTADGSAHVGYDYNTVYGTKSIVAGDLCTTITVPIVDDNNPEPTEFLNVNLSNPNNATIADGQGKITILDTDAGGGPDCHDVGFNVINNNTAIQFTGLTAPITILQVFDPSWSQVFVCSADCNETETVTNLGPGTYYVKVNFYTSNWQEICEKAVYLICGGGSPLVSEQEQDDFFFIAQTDDMQVSLNWTTNSEFKNDKFIVEKSVNGLDFYQINELASLSDAWNTLHNYNDVDLNPVAGTNYYRIKKIHKDGSDRYSAIREVVFEADLSDFLLYPNPADDQLFVSLREFAGNKGTVYIYNSLGLVMMERELSVIPDQPIRFNTRQFDAGAYTVSIKIDGGKRLTKLFVITKR